MQVMLGEGRLLGGQVVPILVDRLKKDNNLRDICLETLTKIASEYVIDDSPASDKVRRSVLSDSRITSR